MVCETFISGVRNRKEAINDLEKRFPYFKTKEIITSKERRRELAIHFVCKCPLYNWKIQLMKENSEGEKKDYSFEKPNLFSIKEDF